MKINNKHLGLVTKKFNDFFLVDLKNREKSGNSDEIRKYAVYAGWTFYVFMAIFSVLDSQELIEQDKGFFYRMDNPPTIDTERSTYLNLTALCEWCMVFSFYTGALTYRKELEGISI